MTETSAIETKTAGHDAGQDATLAFQEFSRAFEAFRETNDERLGQIESRLSADVVTEEKLARIDRTLDQTKARVDRIALEAKRPALGERRDSVEQPAQREHKAAFEAYMRTGDVQGLKLLEEKALSATSGPDGGFLVPVPQERELLRRMALISPIRSLATVREISGSQLKKAFSTTGPASGWVSTRRPRGRRPTARFWRTSRSRRWSFTQCRRRRRQCSTTGPSTSRAGSPTKSRPSSPSGRDRPSSAATASTSPGLARL